MILGITDSHDSGVTIVDDEGRAIFAVNEERLVRQKLYTGWPKKSIEFVLKNIISIDDINIVAIADTGATTFPSRFFSPMNRWLHKSLESKWRPSNPIVDHYRKLLLERTDHPIVKFYSMLYKDYLEKRFGKRVVYVDHHMAHAASAYYTSGFKKALILTADGSGDGCSLTVNIGKDREIERISKTEAKHSTGKFYAKGTLLAGLKRDDAGKLFGLANYSNEDLTDLLDGLIEICEHDKLKICSSYADYTFNQSMRRLEKVFMGKKPEDVAFAFQNKLEIVLTQWVQNAIEFTGIKDIVLAGGVFGNVKLNKRISELPEVKRLFVFPGMADCGLGFGAALYTYHLIYRNRIKPYKMRDVCLGPSYNEDYVKTVIKKYGLQYEKIDEIEGCAAEIISKGKVVGWFQDGMEFGPRALGNRSVLANPSDVKMRDYINKMLKKRDWFMPFAPSIIENDIDRYFYSNHKSDHTAQFMTIAFDCKDKFIEEAPAAMAVDKTARPQFVNNTNPKYLKLLEEYKKITGSSVILNTSFNIHGDPIVCSPQDAIETYLRGGVDVLIIGDFVVSRSMH